MASKVTTKSLKNEVTNKIETDGRLDHFLGNIRLKTTKSVCNLLRIPNLCIISDFQCLEVWPFVILVQYCELYYSTVTHENEVNLLAFKFSLMPIIVNVYWVFEYQNYF